MTEAELTIFKLLAECYRTASDLVPGMDTRAYMDLVDFVNAMLAKREVKQ